MNCVVVIVTFLAEWPTALCRHPRLPLREGVAPRIRSGSATKRKITTTLVRTIAQFDEKCVRNYTQSRHSKGNRTILLIRREVRKELNVI